jgi:superfamily II DNA or RNA helicase
VTATALNLAMDLNGAEDPLPLPGAAVRVRNRRAVVVEVDPFEIAGGQSRRLVRVVYGDGQSPVSEHILWGIEGAAEVRADGLHLASGPTSVRLFRALLQTRKWSTGVPFPGMDPRGGGPVRTPVAPLYAGVSPLPHQLVPLERALAQPNVRLLLADDVGLGKTIEAGLIMTELLARRRIHRILVLVPPGLREQWQRELWQRFAMDFRIIDGPVTRKLKKDLCGDCNPWSLYPRIIASPHYLRAPGPLKEFLEGSATPARPHAPWDLLVVDEAHHLAPRARGPETLLTKMLRAVAPWFDHRVFLTATPHDGYSATYTGLLEILDPVRFRKTAAPTTQERRRQREVVVRRTRRSVAGSQTQVARAVPIAVKFQPSEMAVLESFSKLRQRILRWGIDAGGERHSGALLTMEVLSRRLLSSWTAFDASFQAFMAGLRAGFEVKTLPSVLPSVAGTDSGEPTWSRMTRRLGSWLARYYPHHQGLFDELRDSLAKLAPQAVDGIDSRRDAWIHWLQQEICQSRDSERVVVFTEYVATLEALVEAVNHHLPALAGGVEAVHGQTGTALRRSTLARFCSSDSELSVLLCTDVLAEGLNLHHQARYVFHYDLPWNPAVMQQRVGRLDRLGQGRPVSSFHFRSPAVEELRLHRRLEDKVSQIAGDIGPTVPLLSPLPRPDEPTPATLFRIAATPAEERGPAICARTGPLRETRAGMAAYRASLGANPHSLRQAVSTLMKSLDPTPILQPVDPVALAMGEGSQLYAGLATLVAGPLQEDISSLLFDFRGDWSLEQRGMKVAQIYPGHPLLRWLLARLDGRTAAPWLGLVAGGIGDLPPGLLVFALELAAAEANPLLHQALLPLWLPLLRSPGAPQLGPLEVAGGGVVDRILTGGARLHPGIPCEDRKQLAQLAAQQLELLAKQRAGRLEAALTDHRKEILGNLHGTIHRRVKELSKGLEEGPARALADLETRQRSGVLFPQLAAEMATRRAELRAEMARTADRRERLLEAIEQEARRSHQTFTRRHQLMAPLTLSCEGVVFIWPEGNHGA